MIQHKKAAVAAICLSMLLSAVAGSVGAAGRLPDKLKNKSNGILWEETEIRVSPLGYPQSMHCWPRRTSFP
ncbi:hypothetical protein [Paenibacillus rhizoplanae]|uniref:hypothetical protein n=1 Tax=Paenibacillus rhizoplanae TaxID=1917181 RepID=UPI00361D3CE2